jgi:predicted enzyme related to lactoylglutathione lyase
MKGDSIHFEIVANDADKLAAFYSQVLRWEIGEPMVEMGNYRLINSAGGDNG